MLRFPIYFFTFTLGHAAKTFNFWRCITQKSAKVFDPNANTSVTENWIFFGLEWWNSNFFLDITARDILRGSLAVCTFYDVDWNGWMSLSCFLCLCLFHFLRVLVAAFVFSIFVFISEVLLVCSVLLLQFRTFLLCFWCLISECLCEYACLLARPRRVR